MQISTKPKSQHFNYILHKATSKYIVQCMCTKQMHIFVYDTYGYFGHIAADILDLVSCISVFH